MSDVPANLKYTKTHEWIEEEGDSVKVGITQHAQSMMGDIVYVSLPEANTEFEAGQDCAVVESVKAAADVYSPAGGKVIEINDALNDEPELVNKDPYGQGWLYRMQINDKSALEKLLDAKTYTKQIEEGSE